MEISLDLQQGTDVEKKRDETIPIKETELIVRIFIRGFFTLPILPWLRYVDLFLPKIGGKEGENRIKIILTLNIIQLSLPSRQQSNKSSRDIYSRYFISTDNVTGEIKFFS